MITTVTTTIVSIAGGTGTAIQLMTVIMLVSILIAKELTYASEGNTYRFLARCLDISIVPLVAVFGITVAIKIVATLA